MIEKFPQRDEYIHEINTQDELRFLIRWLSVLFEKYPDSRGEINSISIKLTGKFIGINQSQTISVEKVEGWK